MAKKYQIKVHRVGSEYGKPGDFIKTISRVLRGKSIGNFNPIFCTYWKREYLVQSLEGDLSDPFRRTKDYENSLFIEVWQTVCRFLAKEKNNGHN